MMCKCDKQFAQRYLPHQISWGTELNTKATVPVTIGFQKDICNTCRGLPEKSNPKAELYGRSSKIHRYYWREIAFETIRRFSQWATSQGFDDWTSILIEYDNKYKAIEREVVKEIKILHQNNPKYVYQEESQNEVLKKNEIEIVDLDGVFVKTEERKAAILENNRLVSAEEFVIHHYQKQGYSALETESVPFHVLFGVMMWLLIQDPKDKYCNTLSFGDRNTFEKGASGNLIWTTLPDDFGTIGYYQRKENAINTHIQSLPDDKSEMLQTFDDWIQPSYELRQYLWAHRDEDVNKGRQLIRILPPNTIKTILRYLVEAYWKHYLGWPDLLFYKEGDFFFTEVKASKDKLSEDQKTWVRNNSQVMKLPFRLVKIHRKSLLDEIPFTNSNGAP